MENENKSSKKPNPFEPKKPKPSGNTPPVPMKGAFAWIMVLAAMFLIYQMISMQKDVYNKIKYTPDFVDFVENNKIKDCSIVRDPQKPYLKGELLVKESIDGKDIIKFKVELLDTDDEKKWLKENNVNFDVETPSMIMGQILINILPVLLIFGIIYFLFIRQMRSAGHGAMSFGKSRAKLLNREKNKTTFSDVAGIDEAKEEVQEIIEFLKDPKKFQRLGGRIPKGVMLMGPPGTGKTLLAKAIAGEANVPFFSISGSDFVEMFVGVGASRVRDMFEQGKKSAPCIIFIDEIDAVGRSRFTGIGGGHDEREQTLNALLVEMDGFETQEGVIIVAATNRPDVLDPALLRPGRFDRQIVIDLPTIDGREEILKIHSKEIKLSKAVKLRRIARGTPGFSGADLENILNEAALLAARNDKEAVELEDLEEARDKVKWGRERRSRKMDDKEKKLTAYHEAGHALAQEIMNETEPLHKVTIIPRGMYLGATMSLPSKDSYTEGKQKLLDELVTLMGGRVAEEIIFEEITTGARSDLHVATQIARHMVCDWGMSEAMGPQTFGDNKEVMFLGREVSRSQSYSEETAKKIDLEISKLLTGSHKKASDILVSNRDKLEMIATRLLELETIDGRDVEEIVEQGRVLSDEERDVIDKKKDAEEAAEEKVEAEKKMEAEKEAVPPEKTEEPDK